MLCSTYYCPAIGVIMVATTEILLSIVSAIEGTAVMLSAMQG